MNMMSRIASLLILCIGNNIVHAAQWIAEPVEACVIPYERGKMTQMRQTIAECLHWKSSEKSTLCKGYYKDERLTPLQDSEAVDIEAGSVSLYQNGRSTLKDRVIVKTQDKQLQAQTAYVYRDAKTNQIVRVELLDRVEFLNPEGRIIAQKATFYPQAKEVTVEDAFYRLNIQRHAARLPAWGRARTIERFENGDIKLTQASYTNCSPQDRAWEIDAKSLTLDKAKNKGVAKHAILRILDLPVVYSPYLSFPLSKKRKSGFLMPIVGSTNISGFDLATPYYLNLAPNYDATLIPHWYGKRGVMMGGEFRYLTEQGTGVLQGDFLSHDHTFSQFVNEYAPQFPILTNHSTDRWSYKWMDKRTLFMPNLSFRANVNQVSDNYYLQDFSTNLSDVTERQILREGVLDYTDDHWLLNATVQSYQTLQPVNDTPVSDIYERLPQLLARGDYTDLPFHSHFNITSTFDYFRWPTQSTQALPGPEGQRYHVSPKLSLPYEQPWGYITPAVQWVGNAYNLTDRYPLPNNQLNLSVPRYSVDGGLNLERESNYFHQSYLQTLEPHLYYLNVPFQNQADIPVFDSAYMIFTTDQLFRNNRFSGFDRIGDTNQLSYGLTSRLLQDETGEEKASVTVGQIAYFANRKVFLCYSPTGVCEQEPLALGLLSATSKYSPVASHGIYHMNHLWSVIGDYAWDPATNATNNGQLNLHYQHEENRLFNLGYTYLVNGDITGFPIIPSSLIPATIAQFVPTSPNALNQVSASYAWPFNDYWSTLGAYNYNISKQHEMMALFGVQYDSCCWAFRLLGGRVFRSLNNIALIQPQSQTQYTDSVFFQVLLKGLGSVGNSNPASVLQTFVPGYVDVFR